MSGAKRFLALFLLFALASAVQPAGATVPGGTGMPPAAQFTVQAPAQAVAQAPKLGSALSRGVEVLVANPSALNLQDVPVRATVYFSDGQAPNSSLVVLSQDGVQVPSQVLSVSTYPDGCAEEAQVIFQANVSAGSTASYYVVSGSNDYQPLALSSGGTVTVDVGPFSFSFSTGGELGNLTLDHRKLSVPGLPFVSPWVGATASVYVDGPEMAIISLSGQGGTQGANLSVYRGFPLAHYSASGTVRPLIGYLNSTPFSYVQPSGTNLGLVGPSGVVLPPSRAYCLAGNVTLTLINGSSFQFFAVGRSSGILAYAYQTSGGLFSAWLAFGLNGSRASETLKAASSVSARPLEPLTVISLGFPRTVQVYQPFQVNLTLLFTRSGESNVTASLGPGLLMVSSPPQDILGSGGQKREVSFLLEALTTGSLSWDVTAGGATTSASVLSYVQSLLPNVTACFYVKSAGKPVQGTTVVLSSPGLYLKAQTDADGEACFNVPMGSYNASVYSGSMLMASQEVRVLSSGSYALSISPTVLTAFVFFQDGQPVPAPNYPLVVVYKDGSPIASAFASSWAGQMQSNFSDLPPGQYEVKAFLWGYSSKAEQVVLRGESSVRLYVPSLLPLSLSVEAVGGQPVPNATVQLYSGTELVDQAVTNSSGEVTLAVPASNYTYQVYYEGLMVSQGEVSLSNESVRVNVASSVSLTLIRALTPLGPLPDAQVTVIGPNGQIVFSGKTNSSGSVLALLPRGQLQVEVVSPLAYASAVTSAPLHEESVVAGPSGFLTVLLAALALLWVSFLVVELRLGRRGEQVRKLKSMLEKLEDLYQQGKVSYQIYSKLKEEYTSRLQDLTLRERARGLEKGPSVGQSI